MLGTCLGWMPSGTSGLFGGKRLPELTLQGLAGSPTGIPHSRNTDPSTAPTNRSFSPLGFASPGSRHRQRRTQPTPLPPLHLHPPFLSAPTPERYTNSFRWSSFIPSQTLHNSEKPSKAHNCP